MVLVKEAAHLVAQYIRNNPVPATEVPALIRTTYEALVQAIQGSRSTPEKLLPAVPVRTRLFMSSV
ncbi:MAG: hypothetical protein FD153_1543 [Rhodospirillaceae bacterium]|nr:MAG: hypothetical protein FD153_1543 [Rhodospirillaceae bacterium]